MAKKGLSPKYKKFAVAYATSPNGVAAAKEAGFTGTAASLATTAYRLLRDPDVKAVVAELNGDALQRLTLQRDERLELLSAFAANPDEKTRDRLKALELLGKAFGDFTEKLEVKVDGSFAELLKKARERAHRR